MFYIIFLGELGLEVLAVSPVAPNLTGALETQMPQKISSYVAKARLGRVNLIYTKCADKARPLACSDNSTPYAPIGNRCLYSRKHIAVVAMS